MNKRIRKKKAKQELQQRNPDSLQLVEILSQTDTEYIRKTLNHIAKTINKAITEISIIFAEFCKNLEENFEEFNKQRIIQSRSRTVQVQRNRKSHLVAKSRAHGKKRRRDYWKQKRCNKQTNRKYCHQVKYRRPIKKPRII